MENSEVLRQHEAHKARRARMGMSVAGRASNVYADVERMLADKRRLAREEAQRKADAEQAKRAAMDALEEKLRQMSASEINVVGTAVARFADQPAQQSEIIVGNPKPTMHRIALDILRIYPGVTIEDIKGDVRRRCIVKARRHVIAAIRLYRPDLSLPAIGRFVQKDHTTCLYAVRRFAQDRLGIE